MIWAPLGIIAGVAIGAGYWFGSGPVHPELADNPLPLVVFCLLPGAAITCNLGWGLKHLSLSWFGGRVLYHTRPHLFEALIGAHGALLGFLAVGLLLAVSLLLRV